MPVTADGMRPSDGHREGHGVRVGLPMRCHPDECPYSWPWGDAVPDKTRCAKPPLPQTRPGHEYHAGWRLSTTLGGPCVIAHEAARGEQGSLW